MRVQHSNNFKQFKRDVKIFYCDIYNLLYGVSLTSTVALLRLIYSVVVCTESREVVP